MAKNYDAEIISRVLNMASRGKKKAQAKSSQITDAVKTVSEKKDNRWAIVAAAALVLLVVFLFINSFTIQANIEYEDENGENLLADVDSSQLRFGKSAVTVLFAPVEGYDGAVDYTIKNLPLLKDSTIVQDIAKQLIASYPQSKLELLDDAYVVIYITEAVYLAVSLGYMIMTTVLLVRRKEGDDVVFFAGTAAMTVFSAARLAIGLVMCLQSTKEFVITAGGAPWLALVVTAAAAVISGIFLSKRIRADKNNDKNKAAVKGK